MRRAQLLVVVSTAVILSGCIDWAGADQSWCNVAAVENRHAVCGLGDGTVGGAAPALQHTRIFSAPGNQRVKAMATAGSGVFVAGEFDTELRFGGNFGSNGGVDGFVTRLDGDGNPAQTITFGGTGDEAILRLREGPGGTLMLAGRFTAASTAPGGTSLSTDGVSDSYVALLDGQLAPVRMRDLGATAGSKVELMDVSWANGAIVVSGRVEGTMNVDGVVIGQPGLAQAFAVVLDEQLAYQRHIASYNCFDGYGDSAIIGPDGEVYLALRFRAAGPEDQICQIGSIAVVGPIWHDLLLRLDWADGQPMITWIDGFYFSAKNEYFWKGEWQQGHEAPHMLDFRAGEVVWLRHPPANVPTRDPYARVDFLNPSDAAPIREHRQAGSIVSDGDLRARVVQSNGGLWMFGSFSSDELVFGEETMDLGPIRKGKHGFVRRFGVEDTSADWARAFLGTGEPYGTTITGVHTDPQGRVWMAGVFTNEVVTSDIWLEGDAQDILLFVTEPQP